MNVKVQDPTFELALVSPFLLQTLAEVAQNKGVDHLQGDREFARRTNSSGPHQD